MSNRFESFDGTRYWFDADQRRVLSEKGNFFLQFMRTSERRFSGAQRVFLQIEDRAIQFAGPNGAFVPVGGGRDEFRRTVWEFGSIGHVLHYKLCEGLLVNHEQQADRERDTTNDIEFSTVPKFKNLNQQRLALGHLESILANFSGNWLRASRGEKTVGVFRLTLELRKQIDEGNFLEMH